MSSANYRTCRECYGVKTLSHFPGGLRRYRHLICDECQEQIRNRNLANANTARRICRKCNMSKPLIEFQFYEKETGRRIGTCNSCLYRQRHARNSIDKVFGYRKVWRLFFADQDRHPRHQQSPLYQKAKLAKHNPLKTNWTLLHSDLHDDPI